MLVPKFPSIFRTTENQRFDYKPLYYDEEKEKREKRAKEQGVQNFSGTHSSVRFKSTGAGSLRNSNMRIFLLVVLLSALAVYIITY